MKAKLHVFFFVSLFCISLQVLSQPADIILLNGKIFTSNKSNLYTNAIAIKGNKIIATGNSSAIDKHRGASTKIIDLKGKTVVPGFNDAHYHHSPTPLGYSIQYPNDGSEPTWQQLKDSIINVATTLPAGTFINATMGSVVGTDTTITRKILDQLSPNHPLFIQAYWGHVVYFNTAALKALGISETERDVKGGEFGRYSGTNILNGRALEQTCNYLRQKRPTNEVLFLKSMQELEKEALHFGVTSIQNMCTGASPETYLTALAKQPLSLRFRLIRWGEVKTNGSLMIPAKNVTDATKIPGLVTVSGTKWMLDGTPIERGAWLTKSYKDMPAQNGKFNFTKAEIKNILADLQARKDQPMFHIVGDASINYILTELEKSPSTWNNKRVRFEHGDALLPESFSLAKKLNVVVVQNPSHFTIVKELNERYHEKLQQHAEPVKSLLNAGIPLALGSDGPINPYLNIMFACMHPFRPAEALSVEEAVIAYTKTSAFAEMQDNKGELSPGMLADLVVLSQDIFSIPLPQLPATHSVLTMIDGKIVLNRLE